MKKFLILLITPIIILLGGCGNSNKDANSSVLPGMMEVKIKVNGTPISLILPSDSTNGRMEIVEQNWGATEIKIGKDFQVTISEGEGYIPLTKGDISGNVVNKFKRFVKEEPNLLFWESQITEPEFHFYSVQKVDKTSYTVEDINGDIYSEKAIQTMIDAAKTLKSVEVKNTNS